MIHLHVWLRTLAADLLHVGEIRVAEPDPRLGGLLRGEFRYDSGFLDRSDAFALDPIHLPLTPMVQKAERPQAGIHGCFEDSLPDAWGRGLLIRRHRLPRERQTPPHLLARLGSDGLGALAYTTGPEAPSPSSAEPTRDLEGLIEAAERYDQDPGALSPDDLAQLFRAASSPGGARPKLVLSEGARAGSPSPRPATPRHGRTKRRRPWRGTQAGCPRLRARRGRQAHARRPPDHGEAATRTSPRPHGAEGTTNSGCGPGRRGGGGRQMTFSAVLGNADDHLKNFAVRHEAAGWRLTPAFDLLPDVLGRGEHCLHFGSAGYSPTAAAVRGLAGAFGISRPRAWGLVDEVVAALAGWRARFADFGVPEADCDRLGRDIERRLSGYR